MIRGISKKIIEVNDTGSDFFEKAVFYVRTGKDINDRTLKSEADKIIYSYITDGEKCGQFGYLRNLDKKKNKVKRWVIGLSIATVTVLALLTIYVF